MTSRSVRWGDGTPREILEREFAQTIVQIRTYLDRLEAEGIRDASAVVFACHFADTERSARVGCGDEVWVTNLLLELIGRTMQIANDGDAN